MFTSFPSWSFFSRPPLPEDRLVARLKAGDEKAVEQWYRQYFPRLKRLVETKISLEADAEEVAQEVFLHCVQNISFFQATSQLWTWMQSIARHEVADYYRKKYAKKALTYLPLGELMVGNKVQNAHETAEVVSAVCEQMSEEARELLLSKYLDGKKVVEIAAELGRSLKAVESDLFRARIEFRELYQAQLAAEEGR